MPILMDHLQILSYQSSDYLLAIHSAALSFHGNGLMLPSKSGSGKSTLCLSLINGGFENYSDEVSVITIDKQQLMPLPLPSAIKTGSWQVLLDNFPGINTLPMWKREDGRKLKYVTTPTKKNFPALPVKCIFFPEFNPVNHQCQLTALNAPETLQKLTEEGYQIKDNLTPEKVEKLLQWVSGISSFHLAYSNLDDAHKVIKQCMNKE